MERAGRTDVWPGLGWWVLLNSTATPFVKRFHESTFMDRFREERWVMERIRWVAGSGGRGRSTLARCRFRWWRG